MTEEEFTQEFKQFLKEQTERSRIYFYGISNRERSNKPRKYLIFDLDDLQQLINLVLVERTKER